MSNFIYTTSANFRNPFLIDADKLKDLDKIVISEWERLNISLDEKFKEELEKKFNEDVFLPGYLSEPNIDEKKISERKKTLEERLSSLYVFNKEFTLTIFLDKNKRIEQESFEKALKNVDLLNESPYGFEISFKANDVRFNMSLEKSSLSYRVSPESLSESRDIFAAVEQWTRNVKPPIWQRIWFEWGEASWFLLGAIVFIGLYFVSDLKAVAKYNYRQQAHQLLKDGISENNQSKAAEILLAIQTEYIPPDTLPSNSSLRFTIFAYLGLLVCTILSIKPKSHIGIGKGEDSIKHWRWWIKFIFIIVPAFLITSLVGPFLYDWLFKF